MLSNTIAGAEPEFEQTRDVARRYGVSRQTIIRWANQGVIPATKIGGTWLFRRTDLEDAERAGANR